MSVQQIVVDVLGTIPPPLAYVAVGAAVFAEAALFVGFVVPGESAVLVGGLLASTGHLSVALLAAVVVVAAIVGDTVGFEVGRKLGPRLIGARALRRHRPAIDAARDRLRRKGGVTVVAGRFTALLRALTPALAGMSGMPYRRFLAWNAAGGLLWGAGVTLLGYLAGRSLPLVERSLGGVGLAVASGFVVVGLVAWHRRRRLARFG
ncbi:DedA family protein [Nocardioides guangzhouensis]|uniref:DedA family protein n=1 Tax=Nocardioides guangzhouensis TaxID=2497878 RepID=A0A4Q4Z3I7_9ACTN|nr:DedA family protein [Nocardioides guangzhouensis]RYP81516.1 DedA family protein [Nocardioides guangzhouensis]